MIVSRKITISRNLFLTNSIVALVLLCCSVPFVSAEECGGSGATIVLQSQRQVDNFNNDYGDCKSVYQLEIDSGEDITNLDGLSGIEEITVLTITGNARLETIEGLSSLKTVGFLLRIYDNASLPEFFLPQIEEFGGNGISESFNPLMESWRFPSLKTATKFDLMHSEVKSIDAPNLFKLDELSAFHAGRSSMFYEPNA